MIAVLKRPLVGVIALASLVWACDRAELPAEPEVTVPSRLVAGPDLSALARYDRGGPMLSVEVVSKTIGPDGGSLSLGGFEVVVPAGAVERNTQFTIQLHVDDQLAEYVMADFGPHGARFAAPVTLRLPYAGTTAEGSDARVLWWSGSGWVPLETVRTADGRLQTTTDHFSTYGTEDRGITAAGG